ncbi:uncharacterized protein TRAVEDRAFT_49564 [Trametes versicolor FP-101664 SS1]|uniref:uncharacterized protein n=1 Tax=Trametes versicolor (strain FP-101664) TaxID=717944 RepID=UPI0004623041|nr:uncharacterized protein TRAVEDRAFT_49564 [Trametes versicolor FP-101664 SS1]EIW56742.1 hypothetical protein TRAVEDRAFT_49564 [Trametes versicolor FP-101664 SS1]
MDTLTLEDYVEPVTLNSIPQADFDSRTIRLSLPQLRNLTYIMRYAPNHCNMLLATLPTASLGVLTLCYPEYIPRSEEAHPFDHDLALLLSHPCLTKLESLAVENLRFQYLTLLYRAPVLRFQNINELALTIILDSDETQPTAILEFLVLFPYVKSLSITLRLEQSLTLDLLPDALKLIEGRPGLARYVLGIHLRCEIHHLDPHPFSDNGEAIYEVPAGPTRCTEAHMFFERAWHLVNQYFGVPVNASLEEYSTRVSSYCDADGQTLVLAEHSDLL